MKSDWSMVVLFVYFLHNAVGIRGLVPWLCSTIPNSYLCKWCIPRSCECIVKVI